MNDIVIIGAGGFGREVAWLIEEINKKNSTWNLLGFVDDNINLKNKLIYDYPVVGDLEWLKQQSLNVVCAIGNPKAKKETIDKLQESKNNFPVLIHPNVKYGRNVIFGEGSIICAGNILTVDISIGKHVIINLDCTVGHDAVIGDYSTILPSVNLSGNTTLGECTDIGTGSALIQGVKIGAGTIVGAGATVIKDLPDNCTAVGTPAKVIKSEVVGI